MVLKRMIPLLGIMLMLAGCFRQADEPFDTVNSQNAPQSIAPTQDITIIDPNATDVPPVTVESQQVEPEPTETIVVINPQIEEATATEQIILPATSTPLTVPTATEVTFVTPEAPVEVELPTATPVEETEEPLEPTPTVEGDEDIVVADSECEYVVQSGDNLFRIAINNGVSLNALLEANGLSEASIIQPNQVLTIPDCSEDGESDTTEEEPETIEAPTEEPISDCEYIVQSGDTLYDIAIELEVSLADLLETNGLAENAIIRPDDVLDIPGCAGGDSADAEMSDDVEAEVTEAVSNVTIHTVTADDTLLSIAQLYGVTVNSIIQNNSIPDPNNLSVGQQLLIPELEN